MVLCVKAMCATWQREQSPSVLLGEGTKEHFPWEMACQFLRVVRHKWPSNLHWISTQEKGKHVHIKSYMQMSIAILLIIIKRSQQPNGHLMISV